MNVSITPIPTTTLDSTSVVIDLPETTSAETVADAINGIVFAATTERFRVVYERMPDLSRRLDKAVTNMYLRVLGDTAEYAYNRSRRWFDADIPARLWYVAMTVEEAAFGPTGDTWGRREP